MRSVYERKAQKELESEGWLVDNKSGMGRFSKNRDYYHLFDLLAVKRQEDVRWISIKGHNRGSREHHQQLQLFWLPLGNRKELWIWPDNKKKKQWIKKIYI